MRLSSEMFWRADPAIDAARLLPDWKEFHRVAGRSALAFDQMVKDGRRYACRSFTIHRMNGGGWREEMLATGRGATVIDAVIDAYWAQDRVRVAEIEVMISRRLGGPVAVVVDDDFDALLGDDFEELM